MSEEGGRGRAQRGRGFGRGKSNPPEKRVRLPGQFPPEHMVYKQPRQPGGPAPVPSSEQHRPMYRGRAVTHTAPTAVGSQGPSSVQQPMSELSLTEARGGGEPSRGTMRQRPFEEFIRTRPQTIVSKLGSAGRRVPLQANFFELQTAPNWSLYQYRVDMKPDEDRTSIRKGLLRAHSELLGAYMFDGTVLYTVKKLNPDPLELFSMKKGKEDKEDTQVQIIIKSTINISAGDPHYIQFFNIVLRKCLASLDLQLVGRDYYDAAAKVSIQEHKFEIWPGILTSIRQHEQSVLLNVDISHKIMRHETAFDLLKECKQKYDRVEENFRQSILGTTVITLYNNKTYRVDDIEWSMTPNSTFKKQNQDVSFVSYYRDRYNLHIQYPDQQPLLVSRPKARDIRGGRTDNILLVPELCNLTGLTDSMRTNFNLMKTLADHTRIRPAQRVDKYQSFLSRLTTSQAARNELETWHLKFSNKMVEFTGRVLENESVVLGNEISVKSDNAADWSRAIRGNGMLQKATFDRWGIIYPRKISRDTQSFIRTLINAANGIRYTIAEPIAYEEIPDDRSQTYVQAIEKIINQSSPSLIMCIVPNNRSDRYSAIKKKCCVDRAMPSQVVLSKNLSSKGVMSIATKIAIQMNCKIGGGPWSIVVPFKIPAMIIGFDVCHDTTIKGRAYGAMVASLNGNYTRYYSAVTPHSTGEELSNDLSIQICKAIVQFRKINNALPSKIILYRDGVGDGNIPYVFTHEVELIKAKVQKLYESTPLPLAVIIISKRVNTKIFFNRDNPPPGTVVDDVVTCPDKYDFYLVSQSVKQGTVAPTSYNVISDTTGLTPDIMQRLAYKMTHLYFNWSGTVRVPAQCQYAHKLAFLIAQHIHKQPNLGLSDLLYFL
ncbi:piwi-like protein Siwi [Cimex lectularius]|uniref:Piwi n=1 Tax=Cimex lectularius TaxID=79782 RepID=A0A8I6S6R7_CIMLE|nr:piwi-like protein Siwi [Cimex lectularius]XP_014260032.1 piwi-like protein Siwi [Cimex lectularius]XP_014260034.1 piwi-like protein Siwi [Cimex lectularius]XP_014260035.1 piwi-like protein Siwi [Cimex lectularius]XP_014260036.1 piwi-like protein Siwi [Cimex lectularius]XP_014260037.1 piwi-like protein Siwi [Cimex lectularius]XP_014260038.1 piwi-like protein Siwi [Cimex lectularius]